MTEILRKLQTKDLEYIMEIETSCFSVPWSKNGFESELRHQNTYYNCIEIENKVIGYSGLWKILDEGHIMNVAILPEYRKKGYGKKLIENLFEFCLDNDIIRTTLEARESNKAAIKLYEKMGFEIVGTRPKYYSKPLENAVIMWKELNK